jgi:hypothetical protein
MKPERRLLMAKTKGLLTAAVFLCGVLSLSGCITNKVLNLRRERETRAKEATNLWSLAAVRSGYVVAGSDAFACVDFRDSPGDTPEAFTINLSQSSRIGRTFPEFMPSGYGRAGLDWHFYPLQEAQKGCGHAAGESPTTVSTLKIETIQIRREDQPQPPEMLFSPERGKADEGRLIEVSFAPEGYQAESSGAKDVLLLYLPPAKDAELMQPIGLAGAFESVREWVNPYTLLVPPAVAADTAVSYMIIMLGGRVWEYWGSR